MEIVRDVKIDLTMDDLLRVHGVGQAKNKINKKALDNYRQLLDEALNLIDPVYIYRSLSVAEVGENHLTVETGHRFGVRIMAKLMRTATRVYFMCCTIGPRLEQRVAEYRANGFPAKAYILDSIGSLAVDMLALEGCRMVEEIAEAEGLSSSVALSPGYLGWELTDQRKLFQILEPSKIGVSLTDTCIMTPLKSTTQAIGLGPGLGGKSKVTCDYCSLKARCNFRKSKAS